MTVKTKPFKNEISWILLPHNLDRSISNMLYLLSYKMGNFLLKNHPVKRTPKNLVYPFFNAIAVRKAKIVCNFGLSECKRVKMDLEY